MIDIAVIHLARGKNGSGPLKHFLDSYHAYPAGADHALYVAFKGYEPVSLAQDEAQAAEAGAAPLLLSRDDLLDIGAYREAASLTEARYLVFLNSYTAIAADDWLGKLRDAIARDGVGLAGATGSWESQATNAFHIMQELRRPRDLARWLYKLCYSPRFPNPHIRTNGFIVRRDLFLSLSIPRTSHKQTAYGFESGRHSMTRQVTARGLKTLVVGRDGVYGVDCWHGSQTYCAGRQSNLMLEDNRTRAYSAASAAEKGEMRFRVWGEKFVFGAETV